MVLCPVAPIQVYLCVLYLPIVWFRYDGYSGNPLKQIWVIWWIYEMPMCLKCGLVDAKRLIETYYLWTLVCFETFLHCWLLCVYAHITDWPKLIFGCDSKKLSYIRKILRWPIILFFLCGIAYWTCQSCICLMHVYIWSKRSFAVGIHCVYVKLTNHVKICLISMVIWF